MIEGKTYVYKGRVTPTSIIYRDEKGKKYSYNPLPGEPTNMCITITVKKIIGVNLYAVVDRDGNQYVVDLNPTTETDIDGTTFYMYHGEFSEI